MKNKLKPLYAKHNNKVFFMISLIFMFMLWWLLSITKFKNNGVIPTPHKVFLAFCEILKNGKLFKAVFNTLAYSILSFILSFFMGLLCAIFANIRNEIKNFLTPVFSVLRSAPTLGITFILFMFLKSRTMTVIVAMLITMPLIYTTLYGAINNIDKNLKDMAKVYKIKGYRKVTEIYIPKITPYIFSSCLAGFGLNLKVIIAAEIISVPRMSIGSQILNSNTSLDFTFLFLWVVIAIIISFICEFIITFIMKIAMPYKYSTRDRIFKLLKKLKIKGGKF